MKTLVLASLLFSAPAFASEWALDPVHSQVGFSVKHMVVTNVKGHFNAFTGKVIWDDKEITKSRVTLTIDAASIDSGQIKRDEHLKSAEFFDVAKFPTITFKSTKIEKSGAGLKLTGDLTIHGVTKLATFDVEGPSPAVKGPYCNLISGVHAKTTIKRKDWGLGFNVALESGGVLVSEDVVLELDGEMNPPAPAAK